MSRLDMFQRLCICLLLTVLGSTGHLCGQQTDSEPRQFTGSFEELSPPQTRLVEDWFARYNRVMNKNVSAADGFDLLPQSVKTTFDGVTHALMTSNLTDESGDSLGTALDLVASIETVRGRIEGGRGDHQFRMYCRLIEGAREILEKSVEFGRGHDNTVYHKGYPLSYRQQGGTPSIQVSMTEDGSRADIDVDYRSSKFPAALLNGHLTSANSDIRSGNNFDRHSGRWSGLQNWWANWFALPFIQADMVDDAEQDTRIPARPPKGRKIEQAAFDFLNSWLAEQKPEIAMSYVSSRAFQCLSIDQEAELDLGMAPFQMLAGLKKVNQSLGTVSELTDVLTGIRIPDPELRVVRQKNHAAFVLYNVPESRALAFDCANRGLPANEVPKGSKTKYGKYFATVQHIQPKTGGGQSLALLWGKEGKDWKIISYLTEPVADEIDVPDLTEGIVTGESPTIEGDSAQIEAAAGFVEAWFGAKDPSRAIGYFADES
ncbi:MAG: hypothetical protein JSU96_09770, partial [Acidobacteriota bacterium]